MILSLVNKELNSLDNKLVMEGGSMSAWDRNDLNSKIDQNKRTKLDLIFTLFNLERMKGDFEKALEYAKERSQVTLEVNKTKNLKWAYAIMLQA